MLVLAAAAATQLATATPARAAIPGCFGYSTGSPWKTSFAGVDRVSVSFAYSNFCETSYVVDLMLETKVCQFPAFCQWSVIGRANEVARPNTSNGFPAESECRDGTHRYRSWWRVFASNGDTLLGEGRGPDLELTCDNTPPPPDIQCPKYGDLCRVINPGN